MTIENNMYRCWKKDHVSTHIQSETRYGATPHCEKSRNNAHLYFIKKKFHKVLFSSYCCLSQFSHEAMTFIFFSINHWIFHCTLVLRINYVVLTSQFLIFHWWNSSEYCTLVGWGFSLSSDFRMILHRFFFLPFGDTVGSFFVGFKTQNEWKLTEEKGKKTQTTNQQFNVLFCVFPNGLFCFRVAYKLYTARDSHVKINLVLSPN